MSQPSTSPGVQVQAAVVEPLVSGPVELEAPARREVFVQGLANQLVHEGVMRACGSLDDRSGVDRLTKHV